MNFIECVVRFPGGHIACIFYKDGKSIYLSTFRSKPIPDDKYLADIPDSEEATICGIQLMIIPTKKVKLVDLSTFSDNFIYIENYGEIWKSNTKIEGNLVRPLSKMYSRFCCTKTNYHILCEPSQQLKLKRDFDECQKDKELLQSQLSHALAYNDINES